MQHTTFPAQHSGLFQKHPSPREETSDMGAISSLPDKKVNLIIILLILSDHLLFPHSLVSFRFWSQTTSKVLYFPSNRSDSEKKKTKERESKPQVQADPGGGLERGERGGSCIDTGGQPPPAFHLPPSHQSAKTVFSWLRPPTPQSSPHHCILTFIINILQVIDTVGKHLLLHTAGSSVN